MNNKKVINILMGAAELHNNPACLKIWSGLTVAGGT